MIKPGHENRVPVGLPNQLPENGLLLCARKAIQTLRALQQPDGSWKVPLEGGPSFTARHVLLTHYLMHIDSASETEMIRYIRNEQNQSGGWAAYPGGPSVLDITVLCYAALKAAGTTQDDPALLRAKTVIQQCGGLASITLDTRIPLAFLGQVSMEGFPYLSLKILRVPRWFRPNIYSFNMTRTAFVPLFILLKKKAVRKLPPERGIQELMTSPIAWRLQPENKRKTFSRRNSGLFDGLREVMKARLTWGFVKIASNICRAIDRLFPNHEDESKAFQWIMERQASDGTFGVAYIANMLTLMALDNGPGDKCRACVDKGLEGLKRWLVTDKHGIWQQFVPSTTWETAFALQALLDSGASGDDPAVVTAVNWLVNHQARVVGDCVHRMAWAVEPGGWYFGEALDFYPDSDTTGIVLQALLPVRHLCVDAFRRGINWLLAMEDKDGGWAAWDRNNRDKFYFSMDVIMPGTADLRDVDITARTLFVLGPLAGSACDQDGRIGKAVRRGINFLWRERRADGSWYGHWYVNYVYGTAQVLQAFAKCDLDTHEPRIRQSIRWLEAVQNEDGGWGESKTSYTTNRFEPGPSNPFTTGIVLQGLTAIAGPGSTAIDRGLHYLAQTQKEDGSWQDPLWNGTSIPGAAYLRYNLVPTCVAVTGIFCVLGSGEKTCKIQEDPYKASGFEISTRPSADGLAHSASLRALSNVETAQGFHLKRIR